ncbi:MAG: type I restriction enzyme HsdR N-terminal domain-containing protein [Bacteroidota bacterium]
MESEFSSLNLPTFQFNIQSQGQSKQIFDFVRRRFVTLTPEEWVRQHFLRFMTEYFSYPLSLLAVEKQIIVNGLKQRADVVVYNKNGKPWLIVECKSPTVKLDEDTLHQVVRYNLSLNVPFLVLTNGMEHFCLEYKNETFEFLSTLPAYPQT